MLPVAMLTGASGYLLYHVLPEPFHCAGPFLSEAIRLIQPLLIFSMLFLTFCRIEPKELKPHRWHWWLLLIQGGIFTLLGLAAFILQKTMPEVPLGWIVVLESAMLCMICPTATAAAVVTRKLGGDVAGITTYTVLINLVTAVLVVHLDLTGAGNIKSFCRRFMRFDLCHDFFSFQNGSTEADL